MNYSALIENRKSVRAFTDKHVSVTQIGEIADYFRREVKSLVPEIKTELLFFNDDSREALEGAAGYNQFLVGAPHYLVLLSEKHPLAHLNAGYMMEDLILKVTDMDLGSCWLTFTDSDDVKEAIGIHTDKDVVAIAAFGHGMKTTKRLRLNIRSMSNVDIVAKRQVVEPKRGIFDMAFLNTWGNTHKLNEYIGFFDDMLWEALHAASLSPSYLNRQAYGFVLHDGKITLVRRPDDYTTKLDGDLSLGIVLHHFTEVASGWVKGLHWNFDADPAGLALPEGHQAVACCEL